MVELLEEFEGLFIGNHAFVSALHLVHIDDVNISPGALLEAMWERQLVEQVSVDGNVSKVVLGAR